MSVYSQRSQTSKGSKRVTKNADVDETLFGAKRPTSATGAKRQEDIKRLQDQVQKGELTDPHAILIPKSEIQRMRNNAVITTKEEESHQKRILAEQLEKQQAQAKAKKQRMQEIEAERKKDIPPTQSELEDKMVSNSLQKRAKDLINEQRDEVKHMNQMMLYAKTATIRDKQLEEKKDIVGQKKLEEKRKDLILEVERLKKVKYYEELEREKKIEQKSKALEVVDQIKERELVRLRLQEEKEREGQEIIKGIKQLQVDELNNALKKKAKQRDLNEEIYHANQAAIVSKQEKIIRERAEEEKIIKYNKEKAQKEADYLAEQKRIKEEKEKEVQRLRELQEKAQDRQSEMDALRAKRAVEKAERLAREKEKREAEYKAQMNQDLFESRKIQSLEKERRLQEQAKHERDEFQKVIIQQKLERDLELKTELERKAMVQHHADQVKKQIALREEEQKQKQRTYLEEGKKVKDKLAAEKILLEKIKVEKMTELKSENIPSKYQTDLAKKKIIV